MKPEAKDGWAYLGDSVYVRRTPDRTIELITWNGLSGDPMNQIFLENDAAALTSYLYNKVKS